MHSTAIGLISAGVVALFLALVWHWSTELAAGFAFGVGILIVVSTWSLGRDVGREDEAWKAAAPDLVDPPAGPRP